jgi:hypothetical protein
MDELNRTIMRTIRLKPSEAKLLDATAKRDKMRWSEWARSVLLEAAQKKESKK